MTESPLAPSNSSRLLRTHLAAVERSLLATSEILENAGHTLTKGTAREVFIRDFLEKHLPEGAGFGTGEIIDANSKSGDSRRQIDIEVYKRGYPRISFGGGINAFLAESVVATIEVKSRLDTKELRNAVESARDIKALKGSNPSPGLVYRGVWYPPAILSYVVAFKCQAQLKTVCGWLSAAQSQLGLQTPALPLEEVERLKIPAPSIDGVFVLGKGCIQFDNTDVVSSKTVAKRSENPSIHWEIFDAQDISLFRLFILLTLAISSSVVLPVPFHPGAYLAREQFNASLEWRE